MNILDNTNQNDPIQIDPNKDYTEVLLGPGGKYDVAKYDNDREAAIKALARGKFEGDLYIDHFKGRHDELRQDYLKLREENVSGPKLKEALDLYMQELRQSQTSQLPSANEDKSVLDETKVADMVKTHLAANKQLDREEANAAKVESKLQEVYGPNYKQTVSQQISQLGMTVDFFNDMARKYPDALTRTLGIDGANARETFQSPPTSTQRLDQPNAGNRTWSYYEKMRKTDPVRYREPKTQDQLFKDAATLGAKFEDGDYHRR